MSVYKHKHYKDFFEEIIKAKGAAGRGEYRRLSEILNVHPTLISQVLSGERDFSPEQILKLAHYYGLGKDESRYLIILVEIERAGSKDLRQHFVEMRDEMQKKSLNIEGRVEKSRTLSEIEKSTFYSSWLFAAIQILASTDKPVDFEYVCKRFHLKPERAREIIEFLKSTGMISDEKGFFKAGITRTHLEKKSPYIIKHHSNWRVKALEKSENLSDEELMYSVNVSLSHKDFAKLREEIVVFIQKFLKTVHDSPAEEVAQLNIDFFWM